MDVATVIPAFNPASEYLDQVFECIRGQTVLPAEVVVVDDGSTVPVKAPFRVVRQVNGGVSAARNRGVRETGAPLIHVLDQDEIISPTFYERLLDRVGGADVAFCRMSIGTVDALPTEASMPEASFAEPTDWTSSLIVSNCIGSSAAVLRRSAWEWVGGWKPYPRVQDWRFWLDVALSGGTFVFEPELLAVHRRHGAQETSDIRAMMAEGAKMLTDLRLPLRHRPLRARKVAKLRQMTANDPSPTELARLVATSAPFAPRGALGVLRRSFKH